MKKWLPLLVVSVAVAACGPKNPDDPKFIVAEGNGFKITRADLDKQLQTKLGQMGLPPGAIPPEQLKPFEADVLDELINMEVVVAAAKKVSLAGVQEEADALFARLSESFPEKAEFEARLKEIGFTEQQFRDLIYRQTLIQKYLESRFPAEVTVEDAEAKKFYDDNPEYWKKPENVTVQHVLVRVPKDASDTDVTAKEKEAKAALGRVTKGEDFGKVAAEVSEDPGSKDQGGQLPPFGRGQMVPEFEKVAFETKVEGVSPVFRSPFGWHFLKVLAKTPAGTVPYEEVKDKIVRSLQEDSKAGIAEEVISSLRKEANVKIHLPPAPAPEPIHQKGLPPGAEFEPAQPSGS
ncbi:MAG: peptidylprolyl isomerase [Candidatus Methylacidiphilales bacterium]